jgi:hypothetical protein
MEAIDRYIERLGDPAVRAYWRKINGVDGREAGDGSEAKVSEEQVEEAERSLGFALPPSYRRLVTSTHPEDGVWGVFWIIDPDQFGSDIVTTYLNGDFPLPPFLIAVVDGGGDAYCFDTRSPDERGEYPIVHFDHEMHDEDSTDFETAARDLGDFLLGSLGGETTPTEP